jgi:hypothetical protein
MKLLPRAPEEIFESRVMYRHARALTLQIHAFANKIFVGLVSPSPFPLPQAGEGNKDNCFRCA